MQIRAYDKLGRFYKKVGSNRKSSLGILDWIKRKFGITSFAGIIFFSKTIKFDPTLKDQGQINGMETRQSIFGRVFMDKWIVLSNNLCLITIYRIRTMLISNPSSFSQLDMRKIKIAKKKKASDKS